MNPEQWTELVGYVRVLVPFICVGVVVNGAFTVIMLCEVIANRSGRTRVVT